MFQKSIDILAIGDMTVDSFIRLRDAHIHCKVDHEECEICMSFGAKIPYEYTKTIYAAGGAANAAVATARLGLRAALVSNLGTDQYGRESLIKLQAEKVITRDVRQHPNKQTNCNFILWYGDDRTILVNHVLYEHNFDSLNPAIGKAPKWIYLTSLSSHGTEYEKVLCEYLDARPKVKLAFQPGTYQIDRGIDDLGEIAKRTEVLVLNLEEAHSLLRVNEKDVKKLLRGIADRGPKIVLITDGTNGSYMFDGDDSYHMPLFPDPRKAFERTGCGDAFASTFISMLSFGRSPLEALMAAPVNAMSVAQFIGSHEGLLSLEQLDWLLKNASAEYRPKII